MTQEQVLKQLKSSSMPLMLYSEKGLASRIHEILWAYARGTLSEVELEDFLAQKLEEACYAQEDLEVMEYPEKAVENHSRLHGVFQSYEKALEELENLLWGAVETDDSLADVLRNFIEADKHLVIFENTLDEQIDGFSSDTGPGLSLKA